jgi:hypothetical protein
MDDSAANGKAGTLRERIAHNQADRERAIEKLEGSDWEVEADEITAEHLIEAMQAGAAAVAEATGKHQTVKPSDPPPKSGVTAIIVAVTGGVARINSWPAALVGLAVAAVAALWVWLTKR